MAHIGFTPQSEHTSAATGCRAEAKRPRTCSRTRRRWTRPGAFAVVLEMVPARSRGSPHELRSRPSASAPGRTRDAQVLVWQDMAGLRTGKVPRFVKRYADLAGVLPTATRRSPRRSAAASFPAAEHTF